MSEVSEAPGPTLAQRRAQHALKTLEHVMKHLPDGEPRRLYVSYVSSLGPAILINGLGQALASELARASGQGSGLGHKLLAEGLASWLSDPSDGVFQTGQQGPPAAAAVLHKLCEADQRSYVRAQAEAVAWLSWQKHFARALIGGHDDQPSA